MADDSLTMPADAHVPELLPRHVAIIMDGNGRWATMRGLPRTEGHRAGASAAREVISECVSLGIAHLTLYTFSRENWQRPKEEVGFLFELLVDFVTREMPYMEKHGIRLRVLGEIEALPLAARKTLQYAMKRTTDLKALTLNLALNYSGRDEIIRACTEYAASGASMAELTPERFAQYLYTGGQPDPDLIIRSSGEVRLSNFLLFQCAYSELYFTDVLWPDFSPGHFRLALNAFAKRSRRFGALSETV